MKKLLALLIISVSLFACSKSSENNGNKENSTFGNWSGTYKSTKGNSDEGSINLLIKTDSSITGSITSKSYSEINHLMLSGKLSNDGSIVCRFNYDNQPSSISGQLNSNGTISGTYYMKINWSGSWEVKK